MKRIIMLIAVSLLLGPMSAGAAEKAKEGAGKLSTFEEKLSYSMGLDAGAYFKGMGNDVVIDLLIKGIR